MKGQLTLGILFFVLFPFAFPGQFASQESKHPGSFLCCSRCSCPIICINTLKILNKHFLKMKIRVPQKRNITGVSLSLFFFFTILTKNNSKKKRVVIVVYKLIKSCNQLFLFFYLMAETSMHSKNQQFDQISEISMII